MCLGLLWILFSRKCCPTISFEGHNSTASVHSLDILYLKNNRQSVALILFVRSEIWSSPRQKISSGRHETKILSCNVTSCSTGCTTGFKLWYCLTKKTYQMSDFSINCECYSFEQKIQFLVVVIVYCLFSFTSLITQKRK